MLLYYPGFDVAQIAASGERVAMSFEVEFYNITQNVTIDSLTADNEGHIAAGSFDDGSFDVALNDVVELRHATGPKTARLTLKATEIEAAEAAENDIVTYVIQDDYTPAAPQAAPIYAQDLDNLDAPHIFLATVPIGVSKFAFESGIPKNYRLYVGATEKDRQFSLNDVTQVNGFDISIPGSGRHVHPTTLFDIKEELTTTGSSVEDVHSFTIPANTLQYDGDKLQVRYAGRFETGNSKDITLFLGDDYYSTSNSIAGNFAFDVDIMRIGVNDYLFTVKFFEPIVDSDVPALSTKVSLSKGSLSAADFSIDQDILFQVDDASAGETVLENGFCQFIPAAEIGPPPPAFDPSSLTNIAHRWHTRQITGLSDGDPISTWDDVIGSGDFIGSGGNRPLYYSNSGDPYLEFDGTSDFLQATVTAISSDAVIVAVFEYVTKQDYAIFLNDNAGMQIGLSIVGFNQMICRFPPTVPDLTPPIGSAPTGDIAFLFERIGSAGRVSLNNSETAGSVNPGTFGTTLQLGQFAASPGSYNGNIRVKEIIIIDGILEVGEEISLAGYMLDTYGLTL